MSMISASANERTPPEKRLESHRILKKNSGFFGDFPAVSRENSLEKIRRLPVGIMLPRSIDFQCFHAGTGPHSLIWTMAHYDFYENIQIIYGFDFTIFMLLIYMSS